MAQRVLITDPSWVNHGTSAREARLGNEAMLVAARTYGRGGLLAAENPVGPTASPSMSSRVVPCFVAIPAPGQGVWLSAIETVKTVDHPPPSSSGVRVDLVVARIYDEDAGMVIPGDVKPPIQPGGKTQSGVAVLEVIAGNVGAGPKPIPAAALHLRTVVVPSGANSVLAQSAYQGEGPVAVARGGIIPVHSSGEQDALNSYEGMVVLRRDTGKVEVRLSGRWNALGAVKGRVAYAPVLRGGGAQIALGVGGVAEGRAQVVNKEMTISWNFNLGSTGVDGKTGPLTFDMPPGVVASGTRQMVPASLYCPNQQRLYAGTVVIEAGANFGQVLMPTHFRDCSVQPARNTAPATPTQKGTGIPRIDGESGGEDYPLQQYGWLSASGTVEIA